MPLLNPSGLRLAALVGGLSILGCAPRELVGPASVVHPGCLFEVHVADGRRDPMIALTIDDAPDAATTPAILDTLRAYGAHATFFVITSQLTPPTDPVVSALLRDGHELGNHGTRDRPAVRLDSSGFESDLRQADSAIRSRLSRAGVTAPVRWARPGSGLYSRTMVRTMTRAGYQCALGAVYPLDAQLRWPWLSERYILAHVRPGAIVILHDRGTRGRRTARVLGRVLPQLRARGFRVVTLSTLAAARAR